MRNTFNILMHLQEIDRQLATLESVKGDLPQRLEAITQELESKQAVWQEKENAIRETVTAQQQARDEVVLMREKLKKYQSQLYQVKNNREYDAITIEIENTEKEADALEYKILEYEERLAKLQQERDELNPLIEELGVRRSESQEILEKTLATTRDDEQKLLLEREETVKGLPRQILSTYNRIRSGRGGVALAMLRDGACSECSSRIPPQRGLEIRQMDKLYLCEVCGRIMIWLPEAKSA